MEGKSIEGGADLGKIFGVQHLHGKVDHAAALPGRVVEPGMAIRGHAQRWVAVITPGTMVHQSPGGCPGRLYPHAPEIFRNAYLILDLGSVHHQRNDGVI